MTTNTVSRKVAWLRVVTLAVAAFGGCIVALIPEELVPAVQQAVAEQYEAKTGIKETFYVCKPSQGAGQC